MDIPTGNNVTLSRRNVESLADANPLVTLYREGTEAQLQRGRAWYPTARRKCAAIARQYGSTTSRVVAVLAITSPDAQLITNLRWAREWAARPGAKVGRYPVVMGARCWKAWHAPRPSRYVTGDKVLPFYRAIMGDTDALVLDRWALRLATGSDVTTAANRRNAERLYREAASELGESVRDLQAIIWTIGREAMTRPDGARVRLADIHDS